jgi:NSS family neurotransmitter:Na+ symporter
MIGAAIFSLSAFIIFSAESVFNLIAVAATQYGEPIVGLMMCVFAGWVMHRNKLLEEIRKGNENAEHGWFWKIWPTYVRYVCPIFILVVFIQSLRG